LIPDRTPWPAIGSSSNLWETEQDAKAGQAVLVPHVQRLLEPLMTGPSQLIGAGEVAATDLARQR
jgi:hypothetical protein